MLEYCYLILCVAVSLVSVHADEDWVPTSAGDYDDVMLMCAKENGVTKADLERVLRLENTTIVNPCIWACTLRKSGFLDDKGQYVLYPGLTYVRNIVKNDLAYAGLENIAKECESVKDKPVSDGEAGCEMGGLVAACFMEELYKREHRR